MAKKYVVRLTQDDCLRLTAVLSDDRAGVRLKRRARLLLDADSDRDGGGLTDQAIGRERGVSAATVARVRQLFAEGGLRHVFDLPPSPRKRDTKLARRLCALAAEPPPEGFARWSLRMLAAEMVARSHVEHISHEAVRRVLREANEEYGSD